MRALGLVVNDSDSLTGLSCANGQVAKWNGMIMFPWENQAITSNSDNQWLPVTSQRQIHIEESGGDVGGNHNGRIRIIGYR